MTRRGLKARRNGLYALAAGLRNRGAAMPLVDDHALRQPLV
jgi:hypothetical protein